MNFFSLDEITTEQNAPLAKEEAVQRKKVVKSVLKRSQLLEP